MPSEKKALLDLTSTAEHELSPVRLVAHETISELFRFDIEAVATGTIDARAMLNKPACLSVNHGDKATRYFHGIVAEFGPIETSGVVDSLYRMVLVPQLAQANIRSDCRLFFNKTAEDILKTIFNDAGVTKIAFRLYSQPAPRKATAQYNETSLHFVTRLMEEEGWFYFFEHASDGHTLVVTNDNNGFTTIPGATVHLGVGFVADQLTEFRKSRGFRARQGQPARLRSRRAQQESQGRPEYDPQAWRHGQSRRVPLAGADPRDLAGQGSRQVADGSGRSSSVPGRRRR